MSNNCGAPARYWRVGIDQTNKKINGSIVIAEVYLANSYATNDSNLLAAPGSTVTLDHIAGTYEITSPLDGGGSPILDGAVLVDGDQNTNVTLNIVNSQTPSPWYVHIDLGAGNETTAGVVGIYIVSHHRNSAKDFILSVEGSSDNTNWYVVDRFRLSSFAEGNLWKTTLYGRGDTGRDLGREYIARDGFIPGIVSEDSVVKPNNRVYCLERDTMDVVGRALSDLNGNYVFYGLDPSKEYMVVAVDDDGSPFKQPSAWDHVSPTRGTYQGSMDFQTYQNRQAITNWKCNGIYMPSISPAGVQAVGMSDFYNYQNYTTNPYADKYGYYNSDGSVSTGTSTPLRADQPPVNFAVKTHGYRQNPIFTQSGIDASSGFAFELLVDPISAFWVCLNGFASSASRDWMTYFNSTYEQGLLWAGYQQYRTLEEVAYVLVSSTSLRVIARTKNLGRVDFTIPLSTAMTAGNLHQVIVNFEAGNSIGIYVDGSLVGTHSLAGSGSFVTDVVWNTAVGTWKNEAGHPPVIGPVRLLNNPNADGNGAPGNTYYNWYLDNIDYSLFSMYTAPLSSTEIADLYNEAIGVYQNVVALPGVSGYTSVMLTKAPTFYFPMQDDLTTVTPTAPVTVYPAPNRTVPSTGTSNQSNVPAVFSSGNLTSTTAPGSTRAWFKFASGVSVYILNAYIAFPSFSNTDALTFMTWVRFSSYPTTSADVWQAYGRHRSQSHQTGGNPHWVGELFNLRVTSSGVVEVIYKLYTMDATHVTVNTGYTVPINTNVHLTVRISAASASFTLFANGTPVFTTAFGGALHVGHASETYIRNDSAGMYVRDAALFNKDLTDTEVYDLYNAGI